MGLPRWFFFHLSKVSYWSRTVMVPLLVLMSLRPRARNPRAVAIAELFRTPPAQVRDWIRGPYRSRWGYVFKALDSVLQHVRFPRARARRRHRAGRRVRDRALERRGWAGRHLPGHGQQRDDVRCPRISPGPPGRRRCLAVGAQADGAGRRPSLLPALPVAHLGYFAGRPRVRGSGGGRGGRGGPRLHLAGRAAGDGGAGRLGLEPAKHPGGRLGLPVQQRPLPGCGRHGRGGHAAAPQRRPGARRRRRPRPRLGARHAKPQRRLGRVRRRQQPRLPQPHPVRRPRRAAGPAHRGRHRALRLVPGPDRPRPGRTRHGPRARLPPARAGSGTGVGSAVGAPTTSTAPGRCCAP